MLRTILLPNYLTRKKFNMRLENYFALFTYYSEINDIYRCVGSWPDMEELVLSGNRLERLPGNIGQWQHLRVLRLHCNVIRACPSLSLSSSLKVINNINFANHISLKLDVVQFF